MLKDSFLFYKEWKDAIADLPNDVRLEIYEAIIEYGTSGKLPVLKPIANVAFNFIKTGIDRNSEKYKEVLEKRKEAGRISAEKRKQMKDVEHMPTNTANSTHVESVEHMPTNPTDNVNDNDIIENTTNVVSKKDAAKAATLKRKEEFGKSLIPFVDKYGKDMIRAFFEYWSELTRSETKMRFEKQTTWEVSKRLTTWANKDNAYDKNRNSNSSKQEANEYAVQLLADRLEQREQGLFSEIPKPF